MVGLYDDSSSSSSSSSAAVEEIISEAKDSILLQQISAINCASFTHSHLPTDLESRFNKLKSFPANHTPPPPYYHHHPTPNSTSTPTLPPNPTNTSPSKSNPIQNHPHSSPSQNNNNDHLKPLPKPKQKQPSLSPSSSSSHTSEDSSLFMPTTKTEKHKLSKQNSLWGCFWCSPKKDKNKSSKSKEENVLGLEFDSTDKILSGLGSLSMKEHQKVIKKAMKEEEKINREAEKIVEWAKHVSARINISDIEDELSDN